MNGIIRVSLRFVPFAERNGHNNEKLQSISPAVSDKTFHDKNNFKGENSYKNHIKNISIFVRLATAKPLLFQRTQAPCKGERNQTRSDLV